ncbi:hypothetical protein TCAL_14784 [Tigriopus californicus]|uniref:C2H2-type domain-containing protein n=1 Tax=Tigriopus californicus TaxID=6832 RepID=A0A553PQ54_TIGCA|nr:uncharacterized protein LOC131882026 [Tigriopus californicus]TRY79815.1 hypothetical protein TCAL_14784 [Tigriopus californicus]
MPRRKKRNRSPIEDMDSSESNSQSDPGNPLSSDEDYEIPALKKSKKAVTKNGTIEDGGRRRSTRERRQRCILHYCPKCTASFTDLEELTLHVYSHRIANRGAKAPKAVKAVKQAVEKYACSKCSDKFRTAKALKEHFNVHKASERALFYCGVCQCDYGTAVSLYEHFHDVPDHWENRAVKKGKEISNGSGQTPVLVENSLGYCGTCFFPFMSEKDQGFHKFRICVPTCQTCHQPLGTNGDTFFKHARTHFDLTYKCAKCGQYDLLSEFLEHSEECKVPGQARKIEYMCKSCDFRTPCVKLMFAHGLSHCFVKEMPEDSVSPWASCHHCSEVLEVPQNKKARFKLPKEFAKARVVKIVQSNVHYMIVGQERIVLPQEPSEGVEESDLESIADDTSPSDMKTQVPFGVRSFAKLQMSFKSNLDFLAPTLGSLRELRLKRPGIESNPDLLKRLAEGSMLTKMILGRANDVVVTADLSAPTPNAFKCHQCGKIYSTQKNLEDHIAIECSEPKADPQNDLKPNEAEEELKRLPGTRAKSRTRNGSK